MEEVFLDDEGVKLEFEFDNINFDDVEEAKIFYKKSNGVKGEWVATIDDTNKTVYYVSQSGDFDVLGIIKVQVQITIDGYKGKSNIIEIEVKEGL